MNNRSLVAASLITAGAVSMSASAALIAGWSMSTAVAAATTGSDFDYGAADLGAATAGTMLSGYHAAAATTWSSPAGNGSTYSLSSNNWTAGDYYQISLSTTGYADPITISFDHTRSSTGPATFDVLMSVDGGTSFTAVLSGYTVVQAGFAGSGTTTWNSATNQAGYTMVGVCPSATARQASLIFRIQSTVTTAAGGTNRVEHINVYSGAVPTPGAIALLGVAGLVGRRRR